VAKTYRRDKTDADEKKKRQQQRDNERKKKQTNREGKDE